MNPYQEMHYQALHGGKEAKPRKYSLFYGSQLITVGQPYHFCKAEQKRLKSTGNYNLQKFTIK